LIRTLVSVAPPAHQAVAYIGIGKSGLLPESTGIVWSATRAAAWSVTAAPVAVCQASVHSTVSPLWIRLDRPLLDQWLPEDIELVVNVTLVVRRTLNGPVDLTEAHEAGVDGD